jgi:uncharacterized repeat protein (TIGR03803 family)
MNRHLRLGVLLALCAIAACPAPAGHQVIFRVLTHLDQYAPAAGLTEGSPDTFYFPARGAVFSTTAAGSKTLLGTFDLGYQTAPFVAASNGRLYTAIGNIPTPPYADPGNVISVGTVPGTLQTYPTQMVLPTLTQTMPDGDLFGYEFNPTTYTSSLVISGLNGNVTPIYQFPVDQVVESAIYGTDGNYYAAVAKDRYAYVARVTPSGSLTELASLGNVFFSGYVMSLIQASDGSLYGTTPIGGTGGNGTIYKITPDGQYTVLYDFVSVSGDGNRFPTTIIEASDGNLYGATQGYLSPTLLFRLTAAGKYNAIYEFPENKGCPCLLIQGSNGNIYGTSQTDIFALYAGLPIPHPRALQFSPATGTVGTQVLIWGANLLSPSVSFNGVVASQVVSRGPNYISAWVPGGATTGPITVRTPGGTSTTPASFTVQ